MLLNTYWETEADVTAEGLDVFFGAVDSLFGLILSMAVSYLQLKPTETVKIMVRHKIECGERPVWGWQPSAGESAG